MFKINLGNNRGQNVVIGNGNIIINGVKQDTGDEKIINVFIDKDFEGDLKIESCNNITIKGNINGSLKLTNGDVECNDIFGDVDIVNGDVDAEEIKGNVKTVNGDING